MRCKGYGYGGEAMIQISGDEKGRRSKKQTSKEDAGNHPATIRPKRKPTARYILQVHE